MFRIHFIIILILVLLFGYNEMQGYISDMDIAGDDYIDEIMVSEREIDPNQPMIALTFDDGPGKYTMQILDTLEAYDARASFFLLGIYVDEYPEAVLRMNEMGCDIGNHTTNHARLTTLDAYGIANELSETNSRLEMLIGEGASMMRPPYGSVNELVEANVNAPIVMWSVDARDWENPNKDNVVNHVMDNVKDGDIVILHDIFETTAQATIELIPRLVEEGYQLVTVSEMAKARGVSLESGQKYFEFKQ